MAAWRESRGRRAPESSLAELGEPAGLLPPDRHKDAGTDTEPVPEFGTGVPDYLRLSPGRCSGIIASTAATETIGISVVE
ncbi:hypothetical protein EYF80_037529 [Liparis tanakae]|uniref:Uncharacterized protein n=1 Tax=Liparis tanakae TaxID=230148 RepID=A0A4Z2GH81_9TELE|nr:hypothetical protein EYF80_037529 [Liparis tanakae]